MHGKLLKIEITNGILTKEMHIEDFLLPSRMENPQTLCVSMELRN